MTFRTRGKNFEYRARDTLNKLGWSVQRVPYSGAASGLKGDVRGTDPKNRDWFFECKKTASVDKFLFEVEWMNKLISDAGEGCQTALLFSYHNTPIFCVLHPLQFFKLYFASEKTLNKLFFNVIIGKGKKSISLCRDDIFMFIDKDFKTHFALIKTSTAIFIVCNLIRLHELVIKY